jgi:glycosyltransferase involved in cell wall biosynthesis
VIRSNAIIYSPRVKKIVKSLSKKYSILVLGWNREGVTKEMARNYLCKLELLNLRAPLGRVYLIAFIPIFWIWIFTKLAKVRPKVVHACDFDTIVPCYVYKIMFRKKLVFDVCDRFAMAYISPRFKPLYSTVNWLEELFARHADVLVTVTENMLRTFQRKPNQSAIIMNCAEVLERVDVQEKVREKEESAHVFTIVYTGNVVRGRGLERISSAIKDLQDVRLVIAGKPLDKNLLHILLRLPNVEYKGLLQPADALNLNFGSDVMIILYDLQVPNNKFSMSNKLFEAMMCGLPIITNVSTEFVREVRCGMIVDYNDESQIKSAIIGLRDNPQLCRKLGNNGREAHLQKYNWGIVEKKLQEIYENLM